MVPYTTADQKENNNDKERDQSKSLDDIPFALKCEGNTKIWKKKTVDTEAPENHTRPGLQNEPGTAVTCGNSTALYCTILAFIMFPS
jgi:hypothetical protein